MKKKERKKESIYHTIGFPYNRKNRWKKNYPFTELMRRKNAHKIQITQDGIIHVLSKKKGKYFIAAKVHTYEWDHIYLSVSNLLLEPCLGKRAWWQVIEFYNSTYEANVLGTGTIDHGITIRGEDMPINPKRITKQKQHIEINSLNSPF